MPVKLVWSRNAAMSACCFAAISVAIFWLNQKAMPRIRAAVRVQAEGSMRPGDNLLFVAFGAGLASGAAVVKWGW